MDNKIFKLLKQAGLNKSEITVYTVGLQTGRIGSAALVQETGLRRVTVQLALKNLIHLGACKATPQDGRSLLYEMLPPQSLKAYLGDKIQAITATMEELDRITIDTDSSYIQTQEANGQEAVQKLLEVALQCKRREWRIIAPRKNALAYMSTDYIRYFKQTRKARQITSKTLWEAEFKDTDINLRDLLMRKPRFIPEKQGKIPSMLIAFDEALLSIEGTKQPSAVLLYASNTVQTFNLLFDIAWQACREK